MARSPAPTTPSLADVARLRLVLVRLARRQRQQSGTGLTPSLQSALAVVDTRRSLTLGELAAVEQVSAPTVTRLVDKLEEMGLVVRQADRDDRRVTRVVITDRGHEQLADSRERRDAWLRERLSSIDPSDADAIFAAVEPMERLLAVSDEEDGEDDTA